MDRKAGTVMLLYPERGMTLNGSAAAILRLCDGERSIDAIAHDLASRATGDVDAKTVRRDVVAFLREMRRRGLVVGLDAEDLE
jgi:pyrroloquinoline quinone biosynthesis protein D